MSKPVVFILDPYYADAIQRVKDSPAVDVIYRNEPRIEEWRSEAAALMIRSETRITASDLAEAKKLKVIVKQGVGVDNIDLDAAKKRGVVVCNTPALNSEAVAELTLGLAICVARRIGEFDRRIGRGEVIVRSQVLGQSLFQKTVGIIGMGNIAKIVAQKWIGAMDGRIIAYDPVVPKNAWPEIEHQRVEFLEDLLRQSDVVTLHVPLTSGTRNMIDKPQFDQMKGNAIFLNCARGGIVNEAALLNALTAKKIYGAALDAMESEPPTRAVYEHLLSHDNLIMTPHVGGNTVENQIRSGTAVADTVLAVLEGKDVPNRLV